MTATGAVRGEGRGRGAVRRIIILTTVALAAVGLAACGDDTDDAAGDDGSGDGTIVVREAWARSTAERAANGAVYLEVENTGDADDAIVAAAVDAGVAGRTEVHETVGSGDAGSDGTDGSDGMDTTMTMQQVDAVAVPAGETVVLEPGGFHIMLMGLGEPLVEGDELTVTLTFEQAGDVEVPVEVRAA